jgi:hypothetical protein
MEREITEGQNNFELEKQELIIKHNEEKSK